MSTQPLSTQDVVFRKALVALPQALRDALAEAELDDPGLLRAYPRSTVTQLGIGDHAPPLDLRRRLTKKGGGGSGMAEAGTDLDTAVDTGMDTVCMGRMAGGTDTLPAGSMDLSSIPGAVPVVVPSSSPFVPPLSSPLPFASVVGASESGPETMVSGTSGAGQESEVTAVGFESPSGGKHGTVKGAEVGTGQRVKGVGNATRTAKAGKRKKDRVVAEVSKTLVAGQTKSVGFASSSQMGRNPGKVRSPGQVGHVEDFDGRSARIETGAHFPNSEWTGDEAFDGCSARIETGAHFLKSEFPPHETLDERSARIETGAHFLNSASDAFSRLQCKCPLPASPDSTARSVAAISDSRLLYYTLVADGALPGGFELEFDGLMRTVAPAAERQAKAYAQLKPEDTTLWLLRVKAAQAESEKKIQAESDKFRAAWTQKPRKFRTKFERTLHAGKTQRKDAEDEERNRWIHELALLVEGSQTPMGKLLLEEPTNVSVLGAGLRASILRSIVRHLRRFFSWLELTKGVLPYGTLPANRLPQSQAQRAVQSGRAEERERSIRVLRAGHRRTGCREAYEQRIVPGGLPRNAEQRPPRQAFETSPEDADHVAGSSTAADHGLRHRSLSPCFRMVDTPPELGDAPVLRPPRAVHLASQWLEVNSMGS